MKKRIWKKGLAAMLGLVLSIEAPAVGLYPAHYSYAYTERSATINATSLNVRSGAGTSHSSVAKLTKGTAVTVVGETSDSEGKLWYQIRFSSGGSTTTGYVLSTYVKFPVAYSQDNNFEAQLSAQGFPDSYKDALRQIHAQYPNWTFTARQTGLDWNTVIQNEGVLGRNLVHKNSISSFKSLVDGAYNWDNGTWTGFDGSTWVAASEEILCYYMDPRNFLDEVSVFQFLSQEYDANVHTKEGLVSMLKGTFMEGNVRTNGSAAVGGSSSESSSGSTGTSAGPGGQSAVIVSPGSGQSSSGQSTTTQGVTQEVPGQTPTTAGSEGVVTFESPQASISPNKTTLVGSSVVISAGPGASDSSSQGTTSPSTGGTVSAETTSNVSYADVIMQAAAESGVNPYVIAAMIIQEQGSNGKGNSISGSYGSYNGYYNYFNVGAYASDGMSAVERGLWYASQSGSYGRPWNTPEKAIIGGAQFYGTNYVKAGQNTLYLKKYNVQGSNIYKHQYMTNVDGASSEGSIFAEGFSAALKSTALSFQIPVYSNMPATACAQPTVDGSPNNKLSGLGVEGFALTPTFNKDTASYDLIVDYSVGSANISAAAIDSSATVRGTGNVQLQSGNNDISIVVRAGNGTERTYTIHVVRQSNGPTYNAGAGGVVSGGTSAGSAVTSGTSSGPGVGVGPGGSSAGTSGETTSSTPGGNTAVTVTPGGNNVTIVNP